MYTANYESLAAKFEWDEFLDAFLCVMQHSFLSVAYFKKLSFESNCEASLKFFERACKAKDALMRLDNEIKGIYRETKGVFS